MTQEQGKQTPTEILRDHVKRQDRYTAARQTVTVFTMALAVQQGLGNDKRLISPDVEAKLARWRDEDLFGSDVLAVATGVGGYEEGRPAAFGLEALGFRGSFVSEEALVQLEQVVQRGVDCLPRERVEGE